MMSLQLHFPDGVPKGIQRIVDPDVIHRKVLKGLSDLEKQWTGLAGAADAIVNTKPRWWERVFGIGSPISPEWMHHYLYSEDYWPALPDRPVLYLRILQRLRQLGPRTNPVFPRGDEPSGAEIKDSLIYMAKDAEKLVFKMHRMYENMLDQVGREIAPLCVEVYGEPCSADEASLVAQGDIMTMYQMGRFPSLSPTMARTLKAFLDFYDKA